MKLCPYCNYANQDHATQCRKCDASFVANRPRTLHKDYWFGPQKAHGLRRKALALLVLGLTMKVYWGGYGPWPVTDNPSLAALRNWLEPLFIIGGALAYAAGWVLRRI